MPRKAKRNQPVAAPQDQGYGVRGEQIAAQNAMPLPENNSSPVPGGSPLALQAPPGAGGAPAPPLDPNMIQQMMADMPPPPEGGLARPSERPDEAITQGLGEQVPARNLAADTLDEIAALTGDPQIARMAQRARMI